MLAPNTILQNRYRVVRELGHGGMGTVYEALDQRVNCIVALMCGLSSVFPSFAALPLASAVRLALP